MIALPEQEPDIFISNFHLQIKHPDKERMLLDARMAKLFRDEKVGQLVYPNISLAAKNDKDVYLMSSDEGIFDNEKNNFIFKRQCVLKTPEKFLLKTEEMKYIDETSEVFSDKFVSIEKEPDASPKPNFFVHGRGMRVSIREGLYGLENQVTAKYFSDRKTTLSIQADSAKHFANAHRTQFYKNVVVDHSNFDLSGHTLDLQFLEKEMRIQSLELSNDPDKIEDRIRAKIRDFQIQSQGLSMKFNNSKQPTNVVARGQVLAVSKKHQLKIRSQKLRFEKSNGREKILLDQGITITTKNQRVAKSEKAIIDPSSGDILLEGVASVSQGPQILKGEKIRFSTKNSVISVEKAAGSIKRGQLGI